MAATQLADQFAEDEIQVIAVGHMRHQRLVLLAHGQPIDRVHSRVVEPVSHHPPGVQVDLGPLGTGIDPDTHLAERNRIGSGLLARRQLGHADVSTLAVDQLLAVPGDLIPMHSLEDGLRLPIFQGVLLQAVPVVVQQSPLGPFQIEVPAGRERKHDQALTQALEIDLQTGFRGSLVLLRSRFFALIRRLFRRLFALLCRLCLYILRAALRLSALAFLVRLLLRLCFRILLYILFERHRRGGLPGQEVCVDPGFEVEIPIHEVAVRDEVEVVSSRVEAGTVIVEAVGGDLSRLAPVRGADPDRLKSVHSLLRVGQVGTVS